MHGFIWTTNSRKGRGVRLRFGGKGCSFFHFSEMRHCGVEVLGA